jgi:hypothetical protein
MVIRKTKTKDNEEKATALHNAQKPHAACAAFAQPIYCSGHINILLHVMIYPFSLLLNNLVSHHSHTIRIIPECLTGLLRWTHLLINPPYY